MVKSIPNKIKYYVFGICNLLLISNVSAQIDFTPGLNYVYHQGNKTKDAVGTSNNYSHQFHATFGFRKHWKSDLVPYFNPYFGYVDIQQYFPSVSNLENNSTFTELSSIKQRGAFIGAGFDFKVSDKCYLVAQPEFMLLSSGDQAKTESYSSSLGTSAVRTKISYRTDEIGLKQELPLYRFVLNGGIKFSFHRIDISILYRFMLAKSYGYEKKVWYTVTDLDNGTVTNGSSAFQYKTRLNGFGISVRYLFLDWNY